MDDYNKTHEVSSFRAIKSDPPKQDSACLLIIQGDKIGRKIPLKEGVTLIGRTGETDITIEDSNVSRHHASIINHRDHFTIEDKLSTNGTYVNTQRITDHRLKDRDLIMIGNTVLKFLRLDNLEIAYHDELYRLATRDRFLGIYNKSYCMEKLRKEIINSRRYRKEFSLILFDIDHFKTINDTHGHPAGDAVLKQLSALTENCLREVDTLGRYGGEEFIVILPETDINLGALVAERIRATVHSATFSYKSISISVTVSLGISSLVQLPEESLTPERLIEQADASLYQAKQGGRNRVCQWTS